MKKIHVCILAVLLIAALQAQSATIFPGLMGRQLIDSLRAHYKTSTLLSYDNARTKAYGEIDLSGDSLVCPYSGWTAHGGPTADPLAWASANDFNCEHSWPQSLLSSQSPDPTNDLNHLYGTEMQVNSYRANLPFGECNDNLVNHWSRNNVHQSTIPTSNIDEWAETITNTMFEPREIQKGRSARSMYYILTFYQLGDTTSSFWTQQRDTLYKWHCLHPADAAESTRTYKIAAYQGGKINPFVMDSTLIRRAYFPSIPTNTQVNFASTAVTKNEGDGTLNLTVNISSPSGSSATTVQVVLAGGTGSAADVNNYTPQTLTFPAGSSAQQSAAITITDDALNEGTETVVFRLRNVSGGSSAAIGADSAFTLTIIDNDAPVTTAVSFNPVSISKTEGDAPFNIAVAITNPSSSIATTAEVVLASGTGTAADINAYTTQTVTFPAGSSAAQNVAITITDDALVEGTETLVFKLRDASGGSSAAPGADSAFTLTLADNDGSSSGGQVIGSFADMDGGFELQPAGAIVTNSSISAAGAETSAVWSAQNASGTGTITATGGRSSPKYCTLGATASRRLQSPTVMTSGAIANATQYQVQFYYRSTAAASNCQVGLSPDGTAQPGTYTAVSLPSTGGAWAKATVTQTSGTSASGIKLGVGVIRFSAAAGADIDIDDYAVYAGAAVDNAAPNAPGTVTAAGAKGTTINVSWGAASGGVDGGGYVVVRGTSDPTTAPNINGIYSVGNAIGTGLVAYIGTATSFADNGLAAGTMYYYRVYTADKAFNYSAAATGSGTTSPMAVTLTAFACGFAGDAVLLTWRTESEMDTYQWIIERSGQSNGPFARSAAIAAAGNSNSPREYQWSDQAITAGNTYYYRLGQQDLSGEFRYYGPVSVSVPTLSSATSLRADPNPFRYATSIRYQLQRAQQIDLRVYNAAGQLVRSLGNAPGNRGGNSAEWDGRDLHGRAAAPGVYFYRLTTGSATCQGRVVLIK